MPYKDKEKRNKRLREKYKKLTKEEKEKLLHKMRTYKKNNPNIAKTWRQKNKEHIKMYRLCYNSKKPWIRSYYCAKNRCNNKKQHNYKYYGGKGIKMRMSKEDFEYLWMRDKAYKMKSPTIDRIDNDKDYVIANCRFIERSLNTTLANIRKSYAPKGLN